MVAFERPEPGKHHPASWRAATGGMAFDVDAELAIPTDFAAPQFEGKAAAAWCITALMRLKATSRINAPVISDRPFEEGRDEEGRYWTVEAEAQGTPLLLDPDAGSEISAEALEWVRDLWELAGRIRQQSPRFKIARGAFDQSSFERNPALALVLLWSGLEALLAPSNAELRFRISANAAALVAEVGERPAEQSRVAKLYDVRSAIVHGSATERSQELIQTFDLLRRCIVRILELGRAPATRSSRPRCYHPARLRRSAKASARSLRGAGRPPGRSVSRGGPAPWRVGPRGFPLVDAQYAHGLTAALTGRAARRSSTARIRGSRSVFPRYAQPPERTLRAPGRSDQSWLPPLRQRRDDRQFQDLLLARNVHHVSRATQGGVPFPHAINGDNPPEPSVEDDARFGLERVVVYDLADRCDPDMVDPCRVSVGHPSNW